MLTGSNITNDSSTGLHCRPVVAGGTANLHCKYPLTTNMPCCKSCVLEALPGKKPACSFCRWLDTSFDGMTALLLVQCDTDLYVQGTTSGMCMAYIINTIKSNRPVHLWRVLYADRTPMSNKAFLVCATAELTSPNPASKLVTQSHDWQQPQCKKWFTSIMHQ